MSMLRIKYELISRGISQTEFAKSAGLKPQAVSRIVNGLEPPYTKRGERIADALGWEGDPSELFEEVTMYAKPTTLGQLQAENDRLRELCAMMYRDMQGVLDMSTDTVWVDDIGTLRDETDCHMKVMDELGMPPADYEQRMRELGVEISE